MKNEDIGLADSFTREACDLLEQSLVKINHCLQQLSEPEVWWRPHESANSIGNLLLHLRGNLRQWAICGVGRLKDDRNRDVEFSTVDGFPKSELLQPLKLTVAEATKMIRAQTSSELLQSLEIQGFQVNALQAISHTCSHFVGHTHQIIYITRLQLGERYKFQWSPDSGRDKVPI